jgi:sugar/nucleoside kinase (ribokinase family)
MNRIQVANDAQGRNVLKELQDDGIDTSFMLVRIELRHVTTSYCRYLNVQVAEDGNTPFTYDIVDNQTLVFSQTHIFFRCHAAHWVGALPLCVLRKTHT